MVTYQVVPLEGVPPVLFGMTRSEVRDVMPTAVVSFRKTPYDRVLTDAYHERGGFHVYFDPQDRVEYVELMATPDFEVTYKGKMVFETKADDLIAFIAEEATYDPDNPELGYSFIFPSLELSVWRPVLPNRADDDEGEYFSTIGIGRRGLYSGQL